MQHVLSPILSTEPIKSRLQINSVRRILRVIMKRFKRTKKVNLIGGALVITAVLVVGAAGWALYGNAYNKPQASTQNAPTESPAATPTKSPSAGTTQPISEGRTLNIPQLDIKIINIPDSISDLNYVITSGGGLISAEFSTVTLSNLDSDCSATNSSNGGLTRGDGVYSYNPHIQLLKQFDGFWTSYEHPQGVCTTTNEQAEALNVAQTKDTQTLLSNPDNLQLIK
jgi:hypothetical protein